MSKALAFLAAQQNPAGFWEDWDLPVGPSRMWTTAYVGWRLASSRGVYSDMLDRAADWLESNELPGGGWGYANLTGADADSTALGILFLRTLGREVPGSAVLRLLRFACNDGGFATYGLEQSFGAWTASHVEVTATAVLALTCVGEAQNEVVSAKEFLQRRKRPDGLWDSYWWTSPLYATHVCARVFGGPSRQAIASLRTGNPFEMALQNLLLHRTDHELATAQLSDGSWPSAPVLRLTRRDVFEPHLSADAGPRFADPRRVFTTATVLAALTIR